ncbi:hypothetical protein LEMLEM_LOCUS8970 [Lemmus lemmus]
MYHWCPQVNSLILHLVEGQAGEGRGRCLVRCIHLNSAGENEGL